VPDLTLVMPYYDNGRQLADVQYAGWLEWPEIIKSRFRVVLVDDGSPIAPASAVARPWGLPELEIYRVTVDTPWHQHGARNLGAHVAPEGWLLLTDMDHVLEPTAAAALFDRLPKLNPRAIYTLDRIEADTRKPTLDRNGNPKPHPNSFVLTRELYWKIGGYDEDLTGVYGTDGFFRQRAFSIGKRAHIDIPLVRYWRDIVPDASTTTLPRKEGRDPNAKARILAAKRARGEADMVKVLQFSWERVI
jgi:hypothetical protein